MAQITKNVDKTMVNGSEVFIYTINAAYSGLTIPSQEGKIIDIIPSKINYILPPTGGQIQSITETPVLGGTQLTFKLGTVNSGTSISFTLACYFGEGRVDNDSYTNEIFLLANDEVVAEGVAPTVDLKLDENFKLAKSVSPSGEVNACDELTFNLSLVNTNDPGATIYDVVITDALPPELTPITDFTPIGFDISSSGFSDTSQDGLTGTWEGNTLKFNLPKYSGSNYNIAFKARVAEDVKPGYAFENTGKWTMSGNVRNDAVVPFKVYDPNAIGFDLSKYGNRSTFIGAPIDYEIRTINTGNVTLNDYELEDFIPNEMDITAFRVVASTGIVNYSIYIALESSPNVYTPVVSNVPYGSYPYTELGTFIEGEDRIEKIKLVAQNVLVEKSEFKLYIYGTTNLNATIGGSFTNEVVGKACGIVKNVTRNTLVNGSSDINVKKEITPVQEAYYPLEEFNVILSGETINTTTVNPIFADLMPKGLHYVANSEYFLYHIESTGVTYDSREGNFPITIPEPEVIQNFSGTEDTLIRWSFRDFTMPRDCNIKINFKAFVGIDAGSSFVNKGYMGITGDNAYTVYDEAIDTLDVDGDGLTNDRVSYEEVSGLILNTSEFSIKKFVKGQNDLEYSTSGTTVPGGDIDYRLQITNTQTMDLKNIEIVDILPYIGDTGVIITGDERGSEFDVYDISIAKAEITNLIGDSVESNPDITIEYSTSNDPKRFDELGDAIGTGLWSVNPPADITTVRSIKIKTGDTVTLNPYDRLTINIKAKAPISVPSGKIAYNSYAVRADKIIDGEVEPLLPTEPNKVAVTIANSSMGSIGEFVWLDKNQNGLYESTETGVNGITVELYDNSNNLLETTVTANDFGGNPGYYMFNNLLDGTYKVKFIPSVDYSLTIQQSSQSNGSKPNKTTGFTNLITISNGNDILDVNAGLTSTSIGSIGGIVWDDLNENSIYDDKEPGVNGITVELYDGDENLLKTTVTGNNETGEPGYYKFDMLKAGTYKVKFINEAPYSLTNQNLSVFNGSKPDPTTGFTNKITLTVNQNKTNIDAGLIKCSLPVINAADKTINVGDSFDPMDGVTATNCKGEDITADVVVTSNNVNISVPGIYDVTYSVTDSLGQTSSLTIKVTVLDSADTSYDDAVTDIIESVAQEEKAIANILDAESQKILKAKELDLTSEEMIAINNSVRDMINLLAKLEGVLQEKLLLFKDNYTEGECSNQISNE